MTKLYVSSQVKHKDFWKKYRAALVPYSSLRIISTWIDANEDEVYYKDLWINIVEEVLSADVLVLHNPDDVRLEGCNVEVGIALSNGIPVYAAGVKASWRTLRFHPSIKIFDELSEALDAVEDDFS